MGLLRIAAALLLLASTAFGQTLQVSDFRCGRTNTIQIVDGQPGAVVLFTLHLHRPPTQTPETRISIQRFNADGCAVFKIPLSANSQAQNWNLIARSSSDLRSFTVLQAAGPVLPATIIPHHPASDSFDGNQLHPSWSLLHPALMDYEVSGGALHITPTQTGPLATWVSDNEGPFIYKTVHGDFDVQSTVHAESALTPGTQVPIRFRLGGLIARNPNSAPGSRSSAHVVLGGGNANYPIAVEDKTTYSSTSDWFFQAIPSMDLDLRITRVGDLISRMYRIPGRPMWTVIRADQHPEFGPTAQVGMMAYSFDAPADIHVWFDQIIFY